MTDEATMPAVARHLARVERLAAAIDRVLDGTAAEEEKAVLGRLSLIEAEDVIVRIVARLIELGVQLHELEDQAAFTFTEADRNL